MKRVLVVSNMYPSKNSPHYGVFVKNSVDLLKNNNFSVDVVCMKKHEKRVIKYLCYILFYIRTIIKALLHKYDYIYAHYASHTAMPLLIVNHLCNIPIIMNVHGNDVIPETKEDEKYIDWSRKIIKKSTRIIVPSNYYKNVLMKDFNVAERKIVLFPSGGIDTDIFKKIPHEVAVQELKLDANKTYIGFVSRIEENKGWDIFLRACRSLVNDNIRIIVVGGGSQQKSFEKLVTELKLDKYIEKYDFLSQNDLKFIYNSLDVFVFATTRKSESLGLVGLEAMACEVKTVLPDRYGPSNYGNTQNAFIYKSGDERDLLRAINDALNYKGETIKKNARDTAIMFGRKNNEKILIDIFMKEEKWSI